MFLWFTVIAIENLHQSLLHFAARAAAATGARACQHTI